MQKNYYLLLILSLFLLSTCITLKSSQIFEGEGDIPSANIQVRGIEEIKAKERAYEIYQDMTVEEKVGQLIIARVNLDASPSNSAHIQKIDDFIAQQYVGGIILFNKSNITSQEIYNKINDIKKINALTNDIPLFVSVDIEGGDVNRFSKSDNEVLSTIPSARTMSKKYTPIELKEYAYSIGTELSKFGINMNFAPVVDVRYAETADFLQSRIFGDNAEETSRYSIAFMKGMQKAGVMGVFKHFPGHGGTSLDTHFFSAALQQDYNELLAKDFVPYEQGAKDELMAVMLGHLKINVIDPKNIASASPLVVDFLRNTINFQGLIITDSITMQAVSLRYSAGTFEKTAIKAGVNILLDPKNPKYTHSLLLEAYYKDAELAENINQSVLRILRYKIYMGIL